MVQRLSLFGLVSQEEWPIAMRSLEAVSGMPARDLDISTEIWQPEFRYTPPTAQSAQIEQYRLFLTRREGELPRIEALETPEAGRNNKVVSQSVENTTSIAGSLPGLMQNLGYKLQSEYRKRGNEYVLYGHIVVHVFQLMDNDGKLLDESAQRVVHAFVDVDAVTDLHAVERATRLLLAAQQELRSVVSLRAPGRNSFSTRMPRVDILN